MSDIAVAELPRDFDELRTLILAQRESLPKRIVTKESVYPQSVAAKEFPNRKY